MKRSFCSITDPAIGMVLGALLAVAGCVAQTPKYVPESITEVGPQPKVPDEFIGCWRGTITNFDSAHSFSALIPDSTLRATVTTYEFCFSKQPDGTGRMELTDLEIAGHEARVTSFQNRVTSVDPEYHRGSMRNHATAESSVSLFFFPIHTIQDIYAQETLQMISPDVIAVSGQQVVVVGGNMIGEMTFHTNFTRVPDRPHGGPGKPSESRSLGDVLAATRLDHSGRFYSAVARPISEVPKHGRVLSRGHAPT